MNPISLEPTRRSVQLAVMRAPTATLDEAVAEARRRQDLDEGRRLGDVQVRLIGAAA
jgi:hypothetical protein